MPPFRIPGPPNRDPSDFLRLFSDFHPAALRPPPGNPPLLSGAPPPHMRPTIRRAPPHPAPPSRKYPPKTPPQPPKNAPKISKNAPRHHFLFIWWHRRLACAVPGVPPGQTLLPQASRLARPWWHRRPAWADLGGTGVSPGQTLVARASRLCKPKPIPCAGPAPGRRPKSPSQSTSLSGIVAEKPGGQLRPDLRGAAPRRRHDGLQL
jgi:hypothetical protein